ncbi:MAG: hypothetical protein Q9165_007947 [Trypethelium subeluteriae]
MAFGLLHDLHWGYRTSRPSYQNRPFNERKISRPLDGLTKQQMDEIVDEFMEETQLPGDERTSIHRGAFIAQDPDHYRLSDDDIEQGMSVTPDGEALVSQEEKNCLDLEKNPISGWGVGICKKLRAYPSIVYRLVVCCSLGAMVQGWDQTAVNGANRATGQERRASYIQAAFASLIKLNKTKLQASRELFVIYRSLKEEPDDPWYSTVKQLWTSRRTRNALIASVITMFLQQFCGVNVLAYYSTSALEPLNTIASKPYYLQKGQYHSFVRETKGMKLEAMGTIFSAPVSLHLEFAWKELHWAWKHCVYPSKQFDRPIFLQMVEDWDRRQRKSHEESQTASTGQNEAHTPNANIGTAGRHTFDGIHEPSLRNRPT